METKLGTDIEPWVRGVVYLCDFSDRTNLRVTGELLFYNHLDALTAYSEIPNPASQIVIGQSYEDILMGIEQLHKNMDDTNWLKQLSECI